MLVKLPEHNIILNVHRDHIGRGIAKSHKFYEIGMLNYIKKNIPKKGYYLDIGANIGNHSVFFLKYCTERLISFEPVIENYSYLRTNLKINKLSGALVKCALGEKQGVAGIKIDKDNMGMCRLTKGDTVEIHTLDSFNLRDVTLMKIDCEGYDKRILLGALKTIKDNKPHIFVEAHTDEDKKEINKILNPLGYTSIKSFNSTPTWYYDCSRT